MLARNFIGVTDSNPLRTGVPQVSEAGKMKKAIFTLIFVNTCVFAHEETLLLEQAHTEADTWG